ncbi:hypothetical protein ACFOY2_33060 [Nonomuraea purpurea]|uniref:TIGR04222 domain-containing membrane protein n=1 Tax=Nonomuraea purpurea TaxID=1849276 RepID=A0ABV8GGG1_9ACTN
MHLALLIASIVLAVLVVVIFRSLGREVAVLKAGVPVFQPRELTPYELAYLANGAWHTAFAVIATQVAAQTLRASRDGRVHEVRSGREPSDPLDEQVLQLVAGHPGGRDTYQVREELFHGPYLELLGRRLTDPLVLAACVLAVALLTVLITSFKYDDWRLQRPTPAGQHVLESARKDNPPQAAQGPVAIALYDQRELYEALYGPPPTSYRRPGSRGSGDAPGGGGCGGGCGGP